MHPAVLFFHWSSAHRDLHSFPTRRSSDLNANFIYPRKGGIEVLSRGFARKTAAHLNHRAVEIDVKNREVTFSSGRSEEHTSELQSLTNLVCRLLLEKKK